MPHWPSDFTRTGEIGGIGESTCLTNGARSSARQRPRDGRRLGAEFMPADERDDIDDIDEIPAAAPAGPGQAAVDSPADLPPPPGGEVVADDRTPAGRGVAALKGLDPAKCAQRNRVAAKRDAIDAATFRLAARVPPLPDGARLVGGRGRLPKNEEDALAAINAGLPAGAGSLAASDVHVHYVEAGSSNLAADRFMRLGDSTLRNVARHANSPRFAFMNSHRTGGLSMPAEQPYGKTFAGRYESAIAADGRPFKRAVLGVYMLRGHLPNGEAGPSTDDIHRAIEGGTLQDVSLGFQAGGRSRVVCEVCGNELDAIDAESGDFACAHVPGTHRAMTDEEVAAQEAAGVPEGYATYRLEDATPAEVSAVYDGAIPGAGFRKSLSLSRRGRLGLLSTAEARRAFAPLLSPGELETPGRSAPRIAPNRREPVPKITLSKLARALGVGHDDEIDLPDDPGALLDALEDDAPPPRRPEPPRLAGQAGDRGKAPRPAGAPPEPAAADPTRQEIESLRLQLAGQQAAFEQFQREHTTSAIAERAEAFAAGMVRDGLVTPAERLNVQNLYLRAALDDLRDAEGKVALTTFNPQTKVNETKQGTRAEALAALLRARPANFNALFSPQVPNAGPLGAAALNSLPGPYAALANHAGPALDLDAEGEATRKWAAQREKATAKAARNGTGNGNGAAN